MNDSSMSAAAAWAPRCAAFVLSLACSYAGADGADILLCRQQADRAQRFACYEAIAVRPTAAKPPVPKAAASAPGAEQFGLEQKTLQVALESMESTIAGTFRGWQPGDMIRLSNGQVWQISDDSKGALNAKDPKVAIRRGALGSFYMDIEGTNRSPKVRRAK